VTPGILPDTEQQSTDAIARAKAARAFGAEIARGGYYGRTLFPKCGATSVRLSDPVRPVSHLVVSRLMGSAASSRFVEQLFSAVGDAAPAVRLMAFEFADYPGFRPTADDWRNLTNHRTMAVRIAHYRGTQPVEAGQWFDLPHALPWPYFRDVLLPCTVTRRGGEGPGFIQPFHGAIFSPLQHWLHQAFAPKDLCFSAFCAEAGTGHLHANHQDQGGGIVPVTPSVALVGRGMSGHMKDALCQWGLELVEALVPTETEHVDELFAVLPHLGASSGRALVVLSPVASDSEEATGTTVAAIERTTRSVCEELRRKPGLEDLRVFDLPVRVTGRHTADFNPVNMVSLPVDAGVVCLLAKPNESSLEANYSAALAAIGDSLGYRIETRFVDLRGVAPDHKGGLHCATVDARWT